MAAEEVVDGISGVQVVGSDEYAPGHGVMFLVVIAVGWCWVKCTLGRAAPRGERRP
jgi:hypothetical protein